MAYYKCCQGYFDMACWKGGSLGESSCPDVCNMLEALLCFGCSISSTRALVMDTRNIRPDPCDNRLIALNNALVLLSCLCDILAMFVEELAVVADIVDFIADIVTTIVSSCLLAQTHLELTSAPKPINWNAANQFPRGASKVLAPAPPYPPLILPPIHRRLGREALRVVPSCSHGRTLAATQQSRLDFPFPMMSVPFSMISGHESTGVRAGHLHACSVCIISPPIFVGRGMLTPGGCRSTPPRRGPQAGVDTQAAASHSSSTWADSRLGTEASQGTAGGHTVASPRHPMAASSSTVVSLLMVASNLTAATNTGDETDMEGCWSNLSRHKILSGGLLTSSRVWPACRR